MKINHNIERFYEPHKLFFDVALREIKAGCKQSHWMWYIFPQLKSLGYSHNAFFYGLENIEEAREFYNDGYLGKNLREICRAILECESSDAIEVMGYPDNLKLCSIMTLFYQATDDELFALILKKFYNGEQDSLTLNRIN